MKPRSLLVLAIVVAALAAFIWFVERDLPSTDERGERAKKVLPIETDEVAAVEIRVGEVVTRLERVSSAPVDEGVADEEVLAAPPAAEWRLVEPMAARADGDAVEDLIEDLARLEKERTLEDVAPADVGLAEPRASVGLGSKEGERILLVGEEVPASSNVIVGLAGDAEAFVVDGSFWSDLTRSPGDWRSREVFTADRDAVSEIRLRGASEVRLRRADGGFRVEEPFADEASREKVDDLLDALTGLEVTSYLDGPQDRATLGLEPPDASVSVWLADPGAPVEIALGGPAAEDEAARYVAVGDQVFTAETDLADLAATAAPEWRSTDWTRLEVYEIDAVDLRRGGTTLRLERVDGEWRRDGVEIAYTAASDLLYALRDAEAEKVVERTALALPDEPLYEITLTADESGETLRLYAATDAGYPAERVGRAPLLLLASEAVDELVAKIEAAQRAEPVPAAEAAAEQASDEE